MLAAFAEALMSAQAPMQWGAAYGERSEERENSRNGYRMRPWDTRVGSVDLAVPKLRRGVYSPEFLLQPRRPAEKALMAVVCQAYVEGVSTRRVGRPGQGHGDRVVGCEVAVRRLPNPGSNRQP
jgi:transposase-like protein